uniref:NF-kappa-B inhibitor-like protein 1 n=1 Tax=Phallusia mammillata TaxID=59560 RepID=A0A6F9DMF0_9ASCI|nr:NF-kappa-B inhibitor-like protein 1 [Phallusia mammillata]
MQKHIKQKVFKYVQGGYLMKLKHCLETHKKKDDNFHLDFVTGDLRRTPLHVACLLGDDAIVRCLLYFGSNAQIQDANRDTPMHLAARCIHENSTYTDRKLLIDPLFREYPDAMKLINKWGETPKDILKKAKESFKSMQDFESMAAGEEVGSCYRDSEESSTSTTWHEKLTNEWADDCADIGFAAKFVATGDISEDIPEYQTFDEWADRIAEEYKRRHLSSAEKYKRRKEINMKRKREETRDMKERFEKEQEVYRKRMALKKVEVLESKHQRYQEKMGEHKSSSAKDSKLSFRDIPWPCRGSVKDMVEVILTGMPPSSDQKDKRKFILRQQMLWHPDKFVQRCRDRLDEKDKEVVLETVKALSQELNNLLNQD